LVIIFLLKGVFMVKKEFLVVSSADSSFNSKFDSFGIKYILNQYGEAGWSLKTSFVGHSGTLMGREKEIVYFILERDKL